MTRYVAIALSAEGSTDEAFLWPVIHATALRLATHATIQDMPLLIERSSNRDRASKICEHDLEADVFVVHADASKNARERIERTLLDDIREEARAGCGMAPTRIVGLLPAREMESWALVSPDAIAQSFGYERWPHWAPLSWDPRSVETIEDPKQVLREALGTLWHGFVPSMLVETLEAIGIRVPLQSLDTIASYNAFRLELQAALHALHAVR